MRRSRSVAGLAAHTNFRVGRIKGVTRGIKSHLKIGRVALGAHVIPVLLQARPVQFVIRRNVLVGVLMKPALTAFGLRPRVPGKRERLQTPTGEFDQVLLQWLDTKCVDDPKFAIVARRIGCPHIKAVVSREELRSGTEIVEARVVEIAEHSICICDLHGELVVRAKPVVECVSMTALTRHAAHEFCRSVAMWNWGLVRLAASRDQQGNK